MAGFSAYTSCSAAPYGLSLRAASGANKHGTEVKKEIKVRLMLTKKGIVGIQRRPKVVNNIKFGPSVMEVVKIHGHSWKEGFIKGTIPQLPLSVLNSVIAVCKLLSDLFPGREFSATSVSVTVGLMNLVGCWFDAMPCCHGAGGLAGQYKFGGRSGGCVAILGAAKLILGIELAMTCRDMNSKEESFFMLICAAVSVVGSSAALGFVCGILVHVLLKLRALCVP
ncbi:Molybdate transporter 1 [Hibiscus syriacus]|uniref:Molybdate transporter 1 n=1 Tax=Hibiscus syriacus TaxID=106335 RepID=A0A6A3ASP0_HIBSY|nr:Molybdate transporter 1 [Hibiscus syriacus]